MEFDMALAIREQLLDRREKVAAAVSGVGIEPELTRLLGEVDAALARLDDKSFGICTVCNEPVETARLIADPLVRVCLDHLQPDERRALEDDLELASRIQARLLPERDLRLNAWHIAYEYQPAGAVSGDYCDVITTAGGDFYFVLGDVSGKGISASMLMSHLHGVFRSLISLGFPLDRLVERASRFFRESTLPNLYATLVCGQANGAGEITICNAGHLYPLLVTGREIQALESTALPLGLFSDQKFPLQSVRLQEGDSLVLFTDGISETADRSDEQYGTARLSEVVSRSRTLAPRDMINACLSDLDRFGGGMRKADDATIMVIRRAS